MSRNMIENAANILETVYDSKAREFIVPCLIGKPGIGKSQAVYELARRKNANVVELIASQILPNEVSGITMPVDSTHSMEIYDHVKLSSLKDGDILFFDELLQASPQTLSACLTLLQERKLLSGKKLPDIMVVAACNPLNSPEQVPLAIRQRFMFIDVAFDPDEWSEYMVGKGYDEEMVRAVAKYIAFDNRGEYNVLTPRTAEKIIAWYDLSDKKGRIYVKSFIDHNISPNAAQLIEKHYEKKAIEHEQSDVTDKIIEVVCSKRIEHDPDTSTHTIKEQLEREASKGMADLIGFLMTLPEWEELKDEFEKIKTEDILKDNPPY